jgi:hypothetical protein
MKRFKQTEWRKMVVFLEPTSTSPQIRRDEDGELWAWAGGGKYIWAKNVTKVGGDK